MSLPDRCIWSEPTTRARLIHRLHTVEQMRLRVPQPLPHGLNNLCNKCTSLTTAVWVEADQQTVEKHGLLRHSLIVSHHNKHSPLGSTQSCEPGSEPWRHHNLFDLMESARQGCHFCFVIWHSLEFDFYGCRNEITYLERITSDFRVAKLYVGMPYRDDNNSLEIQYSLEDVLLPKVEPLSRKVVAHHVFSQVEPAPDIHRMDFGNIRRWLQDCTLHHEDCRSYSQRLGNLFPRSRSSRMILVRSHHDGVEMRLKLTPEVPGDAPYATLSYCWGNSSTGAPANLQLKRANLADFMHTIPVVKTPKTILDAAVVTLKLGLKYLWVDSLCIVQDDQEDWSLEASKMPQIYANSYVNIAAVSATDCNGGLDLSRREKMEMNPLVLNLQWGGLAQGRFLVAGEALHARAVHYSPLSSRAWTLQETILGFRTIQFARDYVRWTCMTTSAADAGEKDIPSVARNFDTSIGSTVSWITFLDSFYKPRQLTRQSDRLVALAGIAQLWAHTNNYEPDDYLAGIWKPNIWSELLWVPGRRSVPQPLFVAPSWSWASLDGPFFNIWKNASMLGPSCYAKQAHFRLLKASIEHSGTGSFGSVSYGALHVQGMLRRVQMAYPLAIDFDFESMVDYREVFQSHHIGQQLYEKQTASDGLYSKKANINEYLDDCRMYELLECDCFFLPLAKEAGEPEESELEESDSEIAVDEIALEGLLLQPVAGNPGVYRRIGMLTADVPEGTSEMHELWEVGCQLETENYQRDCGGGVYEFTII